MGGIGGGPPCGPMGGAGVACPGDPAQLRAQRALVAHVVLFVDGHLARLLVEESGGGGASRSGVRGVVLVDQAEEGGLEGELGGHEVSDLDAMRSGKGEDLL